MKIKYLKESSSELDLIRQSIRRTQDHTAPSAKQPVESATVFSLADLDIPKVKCAKCGADCAASRADNIPSEFWPQDTAFGNYCSHCFDTLNDYEASVDSFTLCCADPMRIEVAIQEEDNFDKLVELIQAWNKAKKDPRFVYSQQDVQKMEQDFIKNAKDCGLEVDDTVFTTNSHIS